MISKALLAISVAISSAMMISCASQNHEQAQALQKSGKNFWLSSTAEILLTSEAGDKMALMKNQPFTNGSTGGNRIVIRPDMIKQTISGMGTSFTESTAYVMAHLDPDSRREVMEKLYAETGANFSLTRTPIGSTDFSVEGKYSYAEVEEDAEL